MSQPETNEEWLKHYDKLRLKAWDNYQQTGEPKYDNAHCKYDKICDAFRALIEKADEYDGTIKKRLTNRDYVLDKLVKTEYTRDEVKKLLSDAVYW